MGMNIFGFKIGKRKKTTISTLKSPEEHAFELKQKYKEDIKAVEFDFETKKREVEELFLKKSQERKENEKKVSFEQLIFDAEKEIHPLVYEMTVSGKWAKEYHFSRGKFTLNPYLIHVIEYNNCMFLHVLHKNQTSSFITLYYDKIKKTNQEFKWDYPCDFVLKHQIKIFLFGILEDVRKETMYRNKHYRSEYRASEAFFSDLLKNETELKESFDKKMASLIEQKENCVSSLTNSYQSSLQPLEEEMEWNKQKKEKEEKEKQLKLYEDSISISIPELSFIPKNFQVYDKEIIDNMRKLFHRIHDLFSIEYLLDSEHRHNLHTLYEKDVHELWYSFMQLDEEKQKNDKSRFLSLLNNIHSYLDEIDSRIKLMDEIDYEKKLIYMENKYKKSV